MWKSILAVWGSASLAIGVALYYTHDIRCLWFLLIPAVMSLIHCLIYYIIKLNDDL